jgi:hypothetical protein
MAASRSTGPPPRPDILVRDSKDQSITPMRFTADEWQAFIAGVKAGEFDLYGLGGVDGLV